MSRTAGLAILAVSISLPCAAQSPSPTTSGQPLKPVVELVRQRYCSGDAEVFSVWLKLRVHYKNQSQKTVILDRGIGKAWYRVAVARDAQDLLNGKYEYHPITDWFFSDKDPAPGQSNPLSPGSDFVILQPGQEFQGTIDTAVVAQYENPKSFAGSIRSGVHVLQIELSAWNHPGEASEFAKSWQEVGDLASGVIKTDPLEITIPPNPKVEMNCK